MDSVTIDGVVFERQKPQGQTKIVVLDRGFVVVGNVTHDGNYVVIDNAACVVAWGTTKGLGQLATDGPTAKTVLNPQPRTRVHERQVVQLIDCEATKWKL